MSTARSVEIVRVLALCLLPGVSACAHAKEAAPAAGESQHAQLMQELDLLRQELDERAHLVTQLENRLSLLEAEQRQLRYAMSQRDAAVSGPRETVRVADHATDREQRAARRTEARPVLRLHEEKRGGGGGGAPLQPVPEVSERLPIAPLPATLGMADPPPPEPEPAAPDAYLSAIDMVRRRDFAGALAALDAFLAASPSDTRVTRALFWRGEVLFAQKRYEQALVGFQQALEREPRGQKAADALLKIGLCYQRLGQPERARATFERLKAQFPESDAARLAQAGEA